MPYIPSASIAPRRLFGRTVGRADGRRTDGRADGRLMLMLILVLLSLVLLRLVLLSLSKLPAASTPSSVHGDFVAASSTSWQREQTADATLAKRSLLWLTQRCSPLSKSHKEPSNKETKSRAFSADTLAKCCGAPCPSKAREQF